MDSIKRHIILPRSGGGGSSSIPYHPPPSIGHEIGVMFGGIGAMVVGALLFYVWWHFSLARELKKEEDRVRGLRERGLFDDATRNSAIEEREKRGSGMEI
ncbi:hypothetical protein BU26DRAFT_525836 [Trematosphaeria pertusa]|uniref:Uncharacterized protein n=1 Tax=Trematosphaeria pertusa TaxID=390896 RepID=A0A6A6HR31_9PLEO|nr:uncharacterized protein BU26DRAFT_525836 [Trematosphaeria pertusa]KAF2240605.1 hypothetical protein BU26DRAFT_525836 [Trematosphaeria pertusa]